MWSWAFLVEILFVITLVLFQICLSSSYSLGSVMIGHIYVEIQKILQGFQFVGILVFLNYSLLIILISLLLALKLPFYLLFYWFGFSLILLISLHKFYQYFIYLAKQYFVLLILCIVLLVYISLISPSFLWFLHIYSFFVWFILVLQRLCNVSLVYLFDISLRIFLSRMTSDFILQSNFPK
jgi:hypothetical protein